MTVTDYDPYALSSGLLDDFDGAITEAYFGTDAAYNNGDTVLLILELATDDADKPQETLKLSTGTGWVIENNGKNIVSENGKPRAFNKNSRIGMVLAAALTSGAAETMRGRGTPMEAATWQGLSFHWNRTNITGFDGESREVLLPTKFNGEGNTTTASGSSTTTGLSDALRAQLTAAAAKAADHSEFIDAAFNIDGVMGNTEATELVVDPAFFNSVKG